LFGNDISTHRGLLFLTLGQWWFAWLKTQLRREYGLPTQEAKSRSAVKVLETQKLKVKRLTVQTVLQKNMTLGDVCSGTISILTEEPCF
jgi:hypothetical protein